MARRCDETVDKKRVNSCVLKFLFWRELSNQEYRPKNTEMLSPTRSNVTFSKFARFFEIALRATLMENYVEFIRGQRF